MFAFSGATAATLFLLLPSSSPLWPISALLAICANVAFGASVVAMNAYLPLLARSSEEVTEARGELQAAIDTVATTRWSSESATENTANTTEPVASEPLLPHNSDINTTTDIATLQDAYHNVLSRATSRISSQGIALGYAAGILLLLVALVPDTLLHGTTFSLRLAIGLSGIWWAVFSLPAAAWLPSTGEAKFPVDSLEQEWGWDEDETSTISKNWSLSREIVKAWKGLGAMLRWRGIKQLRNTFQYLAAWFLLSDGTGSV